MVSFRVCAERCGIADMGLFTLFLIIFIGQSLSYELFEEQEKRQQLFPFPRVGRSSVWDFIEEKRGGLVPFPRTGRSDGKRQGLIPFPRIGRSLEDLINYYITADDDVKELLDDWLENTEFDISLLPIFKRANFLPRIGKRKKRSINEDLDDIDEEKHQLLPSNDISDQRQHHLTRSRAATDADVMNNDSDLSNSQNQWQASPLDPPMIEDNFNWRPIEGPERLERQLVPYPRIGRGMFNPRVGKKYTQKIRSEFGKRAALIPRVGRSDPMIQTRAAFQPRVGRALIPRVGRSGNNREYY